MPIKTESKKIGELCEVTSSKRIFASEYVKTGIPFYRGKEIIEKQKGNLQISTELFISEAKYQEIKNKYGAPKPGELLLTSVGTLGVPYVIKEGEKFYFKDGNLLWLKNFNGLDSKYLYYWFLSNKGKEQLKKSTIGSSQSAFTISLVKEIELELPSPNIQKQIASILSAFDNLIENNTRRIEILEEMARRIYREWFVHFRYPGHEHNRMVDSELGEIPEGWEVMKLGEVIELKYGKSLKKSDRIEGPYPVYGSSGIVGWHNNYYKEGPGIIVGRKGNVGSVFWEFDNFFPIDTSYFVETALPLTYAYYNLKHQNFINNDAAVPGLSKKQADLLPILIPEDEILNNFDDYILPLFEQIKNYEKSNNFLKEQRDLLLPKLISGGLILQTRS